MSLLVHPRAFSLASENAERSLLMHKRMEDEMQGSIRRLFKDGYNTADWLLTRLVRCGYWVNPGAKILDFGCGAGELVYSLRDFGFDAYGFDIHNGVRLRTPDDRKYFNFAPQDAVSPFSMVVGSEHVRTSFADSSFDLIVSTSVLEHVLDHEPLMAETARLLKPEGMAVHVYPGRASFVEPHIFVPFGTRVQNWWWLYFWAHFGGKSDFQRSMTARQTADANLGYCRTGLSYPHKTDLIAIAERHFDDVHIVSRPWYSFLERLLQPVYTFADMRKMNPLKAIAMRQLLDVMITTQKKQAGQAPQAAVSRAAAGTEPLGVCASR